MSGLYLICKIANTEYALAADDIYQMENYSPITPVPGAPPYVAGLVQVRQQVVPIVDPRVRFGLGTQAPTADSRFVILKLQSRLVGLLVDSAREVRNFTESEFNEPPGVAGDGPYRFVKSVAQLKNRIILLIDSLKIVGKEMQNG